MNYYQIAIISRNLKPLCYHSDRDFNEFDIVKITLNNKELLGIVLEKINKPDFKTLAILDDSNLRFTKIQIELIKFISYYYICEIGLSAKLFIAQNKNFKNLNSNTDYKMPNLSESQQKALNFTENKKCSLIFGDTGSGKSEIYISAIIKQLKNNEKALFLMPEISLSPQMEKRLKAYFGDELAIWHSKISNKRKKEILEKLEKGEIRIIAGARSALFLPINNLKIIIIDEEHDDSYKNQNKPFYNARDLAIFISNKFDIKCILGSATPSLNTYIKQDFFRLKGTFFSGNKNYIFDEDYGLTDTIKNEIQISLNEEKQTIICLPIRANFKFINCKNCETTVKCPFCSISMSLYKFPPELKCQFCGFRSPIVQKCEICNSDVMEAKKMGTGELFDQLKANFPNAKIAKFDRDEITTQKKLEKILNDFNDKKIDILIGTQMLSKGHDYHSVDLAIMLGFDDLFYMPDFRAKERCLSLVKQVCGRAGRAGKSRVIIQSKFKEFFINYIDNYDIFLDSQKDERIELYPPFTRLLRATINHKDEKTAKEICENMIKKISNNLINNKELLEIVGFGKCQIEKLNDKFRYEILLRSKNFKSLLKAGQILNKEYINVDMDPINFI